MSLPPQNKRSSRTPRTHTGARAESVVANYLVNLGFVILDRNVRVGHLEIDLLARLDDLVAVVEVRHRGSGSWQGPFESISPAKRERMRKAGKILWQRRFARDPTINRMRFDVAAVTFEVDDRASVEYVSAAF
ncbi:MAG: YraN family protein [Deltaproteobacteria bacterium]|nr:YraN family protein [Deltaproteobacteria bacterium]